MKEGGMKPTDPALKALMEEEFMKEFDFSKVESRPITINLNNEIVDYFKKLSMKTGKGYQVLIKDALTYFIDEKLEPKTVWKKK